MWCEGMDPVYELRCEVGGECAGIAVVRARSREILGYAANDSTQTDPVDEDLGLQAHSWVLHGIGKVVQRGLSYITVLRVYSTWFVLTNCREPFPRKGSPPDAAANEV